MGENGTNTIMPVAPANYGNYGGDGMGYGMSWMWVIVIFLLLGVGGYNNGYGRNDTLTNDFLYTNLNSTIQRGFNENTSQNFQIQKDISQSTCGIQRDVLSTGAGIQRDILTTGASITNELDNRAGQIQLGIRENVDNMMLNMHQGFDANQAGITEAIFKSQQEACETNRNIDNVKYEMAKSLGAITNNDNANTQKILDRICQMENNAKDQQIQDLQVKLANANYQISQQMQNATLIGALRPYPQPAYLTSSPYISYNQGGYFYGA